MLCILTPSKPKWIKYSHNKCQDKSALIEKTLKFANSQKAKKKKKNRTKVCNLTKAIKSKVSCRECWCDGIRKNLTSYSKSYLVYVPSFKSINSIFLSRKKSKFKITRSNTFLGIGLDELTEPRDTMKYKPFLKHFTNYFTHVIAVYICVEQNLLL